MQISNLAGQPGKVVAWVVVLSVVVSFFFAWLAMLTIGALMSYREWSIAPPGYWETFFGLWVVRYAGSAWNTSLAGANK